jgi:hypothetical protein
MRAFEVTLSKVGDADIYTVLVSGKKVGFIISNAERAVSADGGGDIFWTKLRKIVSDA